MPIFKEIADRLGQSDDALEVIAEFALETMEEGFLQEQDPEGAQHAALDPDYAATKKGPGILREDLVLIESMTFELLDEAVAVGPDDTVQPGQKIGVHQRGGQGGGGSRIKARPYVGISDANAEAVPEIMLVHMIGGVGESEQTAEFPL